MYQTLFQELAQISSKAVLVNLFIRSVTRKVTTSDLEYHMTLIIIVFSVVVMN